jgi:hypothetical protein
MTHDYHRPTLKFPDGSGYNPSQVRLYGIANQEERRVESVDKGQSVSFPIDAGAFSIIVEVNNESSIDGDGLFATHIVVTMKKLGTLVMTATLTKGLQARTGNEISCGIIVGYAYEGHTYDLPKPKIMILPVRPEVRIPDDDSGYDAKKDENYAVWLVDKLDECAEFEMNQGFVEQLVLDANLPGRRAPNMYVGRMMLGHRSGKLSD